MFTERKFVKVTPRREHYLRFREARGSRWPGKEERKNPQDEESLLFRKDFLGLGEDRGRGITRFAPLREIYLPFVLAILLGDCHSVLGGLVHLIVRLYAHSVRYGTETLEAPAETRENRGKS